MRLWSIHPQYLDTKGLVAVWREGLLAQAVLLGKTQGYQHHPQLLRFRQQLEPIQAIANYLHAIADEADVRGYTFARYKLTPQKLIQPILVTDGQIAYERQHLVQKLTKRDPLLLEKIPLHPEAHPSFRVVVGHIESWEKIS